LGLASVKILWRLLGAGVQNKEIIFIAPLPAIAKRTRIAKMVSVLLDNDYSVAFYGWQRQRGEALAISYNDPNVSEGNLLTGGGYASRLARMMYPIWMIVVFFKVLRLGREKEIFCLGWETAFPALLASRFTKSSIVFDDADRFSLIIKLPWKLHAGLKRLEKWASYKAVLHIVPGLSRYEWKHDKMLVLKNAPTRADFKTAMEQGPERGEHGLILYANGWIGQTRGAGIFLEAMNQIQSLGLDVRMHVAGRVDSDDGEMLIRHQLVDFHGEVSQAEALALYPVSDVVLTYYDPKVSINKLAESNKWGDCVFLKKPFFVNEEVITAKRFVDKGAAFAVKYNDVSGLIGLVKDMINDKVILENARRNTQLFQDEFPPFDDQFLTLMYKLSRGV
jgi:hypothetical protein